MSECGVDHLADRYFSPVVTLEKCYHQGEEWISLERWAIPKQLRTLGRWSAHSWLGIYYRKGEGEPETLWIFDTTDDLDDPTIREAWELEKRILHNNAVRLGIVSDG